MINIKKTALFACVATTMFLASCETEVIGPGSDMNLQGAGDSQQQELPTQALNGPAVEKDQAYKLEASE